MNKAVSKIQEEAKRYILKNHFNDALDLVNGFIGEYDLTNTQIEKHLILISKEYFDIRQRGINGTLTHEEVARIEANLTSRFLVLIDDLNELEEQKLSKKNDDHGGGLVSADYFLNNQLNYFIAQIISSDDKINHLTITIEDKKIEITKTKNVAKIDVLNTEIEKLKQELEAEKENFNSIKSEYDDLKLKYDELSKSENGQYQHLFTEFCKNCSSVLSNGSICTNCGYENDDLKMIRSQLQLLKNQIEVVFNAREENDKIFNQVKQTNFLILQYLDDLNRRLIKIEKKLE